MKQIDYSKTVFVVTKLLLLMQTTNHRLPIEESSKVISEMSQFLQQQQQQEGEKSRSKSSRSKSEYVTQKEMQKLAKMEGRGEDPKGRHMHEKVPSTSAIAPHSMRQQHYPVLQMSERYTDSPGLYIAGQGRGQQIPPIAGRDCGSTLLFA